MPEFILDHGTDETGTAFASLDAFTQGYIEAMFFTEAHADNPELANATVSDLAADTWAKIVADCDAFIPAFDYLESRASDHQLSAWPDDAAAGRDFWYTRNGHGAGFWDGDWPEPFGDLLTQAAKAFGETDLYRGDDGKLYLA